VTGAAASVELDPLENESLRRRFRGLEVAMNRDAVCAELQTLLFDGSGSAVESCGRPRAEVGEESCWLQYPLRVRAPSGVLRDVTVLGTMFTSLDEASAFERTTLAPQGASASSDLGVARATGVVDSLRLALSVFPVNGSLPTLVHATNPEHVSNLLASALAERTTVIAVELVELRRTRGCVLRYRLDSATNPTVYGKVGPTATGEIVQRGLDALAGGALSGRRDQIFFPRVLGHSSELELTLVSEVPGKPPDLAVEQERARAVDGAALVAAWLHASGVRVGAVRSFDDELGRAADAIRAVRRDAPDLAARLARVLDAVTAASERISPQVPALSHGSFAPSQLMLDGSRTGVLDFDRLCDAEPAFDLGRFLAPLRVTLAKRENAAGDALASLLMQRYQDHGGGAAPEARTHLYELAALLRMAARSWLQLKAARLRLVSQILDARAAHLENGA
jgi:hypothetical protein